MLFRTARKACCLTLATALSASAMTVGDPRCEYAVNPVGIDTLKPRLSWKLIDDARGQIQTAYQIRVAASPEDLEKGANLLWDTGKTASCENTHIEYSGESLQPGARCYWQVRAWDRQGAPSPWNSTAFWQVALLDDAAWKARWIGLPSDGVPAWSNVTITADVTLLTNAIGIVFRAQDANNFYMWQFNNGLGPDLALRPHVCKGGQWAVLQAASLRAVVPPADDYKAHRIEIETAGDLIRTRIDGKVVDELRDATFVSGTVGFRADSKERFAVDNLTVTDGEGAVVLKDDYAKAGVSFPKATVSDGRLTVSGATLLHRPPLPKDCPRLRKTFTIDKAVRRATASACGLGFYELYVNGAKADSRVLAPANTPYAQRFLFDTVDVTHLIKPGPNALGLWLAPGYSDDYSQWGWKWEESKRAILQLDLVFEDGTTAAVVTDESWRAGQSPLTFASLYDGETFDASLETPGWSEAGFDDNGWSAVRALPELKAALKPNAMPPLRVTQRLRPVSVAEPKPGVFVFDMGQNFAGWVSLRATGPRGTRVVLRHSELLNPDGTLDFFTNRRAKSTDTFILRGEGPENYEPRFTYHGFRFVEVTGYPGRPSRDDVTGCVVHSDVMPAGTFTCSDATLNRVYSNCLWSMRSNFMSIPTDCCMRDERTPCQMDSLAYEDASLCSFEMNRYYTKWLDDITGGRGNPDWNGDMVFLPWRLYRQYGDRRILEAHYANMRAYAEHLAAKTPGHIYADGFGDWCPPNDGSWAGYHGDVTEVNTCLYAALARIVADTAALLGKADDAARFGRLSDDIAKAFNEKRYDTARAAYGDGSQTTALLPLALGLVPADRRAAVFARLAETIRTKDKGRLDTGIFGTRYLLEVLADFGEADLGIAMLTQPEYPGFGFQIAQGATTLWEQWTVKGGMNSHNHAMFAGVCAPFYTRLGGITPLKPGFAEIGIRPSFPKSLSFAEASEETVKGRVAVRWQRANGLVRVAVTIPVNAFARVALPAAGQRDVQPDGAAFVGMEDGRAVYSAGSGSYQFLVTEKQAQ